MKIIKSPLNYIGGKYKILPQIIPLFPKKINKFVDLFAGGCNVGINIVDAREIYLNDNLIYLINLYKAFKSNNIDCILNHIKSRINQFDLSLTNEKGYKELRKLYNKQKNPLDLFVLIAYSFNHQIRFNNDHEFNNPFGKDRSFNETMERNLRLFVEKIQTKKRKLLNVSFDEFDFSCLSKNDFVYCDPPYLITVGSYNDGKRGFKGWTEKEEKKLLEILSNLDKSGIKFALSNVLDHKGKSNDILKQWIEKHPTFRVNPINFHYSNSNYHTIIRDKKSTTEVLITNYTQ